MRDYKQEQRNRDLIVNCNLNIASNIVKALGLSKDEIACTLKKRVSCLLFSKKHSKLWAGKAACEYFSMGFSESS